MVRPTAEKPLYNMVELCARDTTYKLPSPSEHRAWRPVNTGVVIIRYVMFNLVCLLCFLKVGTSRLSVEIGVFNGFRLVGCQGLLEDVPLVAGQRHSAAQVLVSPTESKTLGRIGKNRASKSGLRDESPGMINGCDSPGCDSPGCRGCELCIY